MLSELAQKQNTEKHFFRWEDHYHIINKALTIRLVERRLLDLFRQGKLFGTIHTCIGQEFSGISVAQHLTEKDWVFSNHRCHGHYLALTDDVEGLIAEVMGKTSGICQGRGGSQHLHNGRFFSSGIQGGFSPIAAGVALAEKIAQTSQIATLFIGDGTLGQGVLYETLNIVSKWKLPLLIVLENNGWAQSTPQSQTLAGSIVDRFAAFGIEPRYSDTWNWLDLMEDMKRSVSEVRATGRPHFHQIDTYRLEAHSKGDDTRRPDHVRHYQNCDPLNILLENKTDHPQLTSMIQQINERIDQAVVKAEKTPFARHKPAGIGPRCPMWNNCVFEREKINDSIYRTLSDSLNSNEKLILVGEDIQSPYGGAFKITRNLSDRFQERVRNTPISEAALAGLGNGLALAGMLPVVEIMFGDFITLTADQWINHAAILNTLYDSQIRVPIILRTPMGGKRGYGPTHSQCLEKHFLGVPGTQVLCLHHRYSGRLLYEALFENIDRPTLVIENKSLYGRYADPDPPAGYQLLRTDESFPWVRLKPCANPDLTLVAIGGMSCDAEEAMKILFEEHELIVELFFPSRLYPLDIQVLKDSITHSGRLLVAEEGQGFVSLTSEILAQVHERFGGQGLRCRRVAAQPGPVPAARPLEQFHLPGAIQIVTAALNLMEDDSD